MSKRMERLARLIFLNRYENIEVGIPAEGLVLVYG
jgi:hypothetical protein